jgi:uroporphyrin-3 C-methyltransferase
MVTEIMVKEIKVTEKLDTDQPENEAVKASAIEKVEVVKTAKTKKVETAPKKPLSLLAVLALFLVLLSFVAIAGLGWKGFELIQQLSSVELKLQQSEQEKASVAKSLSQIQQQLIKQDKQQQHTSQRIAQLPGADTDDWLVAEAEYLLRLANQRLSLEKDLKGALAILLAADNVLLETDNPQFDNVRIQLAKEVLTLRSVPAVDTTGAVSRIQAVQDQVSNLEWMPRNLPKQAVTTEVVVEGVEVNAWQKFTAKAWAGLGSIVRIREHDKALPAPLTPDQHYYLQQNMQLMLEQAQVALVRQQADLYLHSIQRTQAWLNEFVRSETAQAKALQQTLEELAKWQVAPAFPDISGSLIELRRYSAASNHAINSQATKIPAK